MLRSPLAALPRRVAAAALLSLAAAVPAVALASPSSSASSASDSLSTSVGSISDSFRGSSNSSSNNDKVADGRYRIDNVAAVAGRPDRLRVELRPEDATQGQPFALELPQHVLADADLHAGRVIEARNKPYGVEFALADTRKPFFLALDDAWFNELPSRPVTL